MPKHGTKILYVASLILTIALIGYLWLAFLPQFEGRIEYPSMRVLVLFIIMLLLATAGAQIVLLRRPPRSEEFEN